MDLPKIKALIDLLNNSGLTALELDEGEHCLRLERQPGGVPAAAGQAVPVAHVAAAAAVAPAAAPASAPASASGHVVASPMQGILHLTPAPGEPPFVKVGDTVQLEQVVCVVEAMKMFNTVEADAAGRVAEILVVSGSEVRVGQPLFRLA